MILGTDELPANNMATGYNRTRKKYKINREQNRDQTTGRKRMQTNVENDGAPIAAVLPRR